MRERTSNVAQQTLNWYTRTYPNFLDDELCDAYVQTFEETMEKDADEVSNTSFCYGPQVGVGGNLFVEIVIVKE